jgi:hypothetical protein
MFGGHVKHNHCSWHARLNYVRSQTICPECGLPPDPPVLYCKACGRQHGPGGLAYRSTCCRDAFRADRRDTWARSFPAEPPLTEPPLTERSDSPIRKPLKVTPCHSAPPLNIPPVLNGRRSADLCRALSERLGSAWVVWISIWAVAAVIVIFEVVRILSVLRTY